MVRVNIEVSDEVHKKAKIACAQAGITMIEYINKAIAEKIESEKHR